MLKPVLSREAERDYEEILYYTATHFSAAQARRYARLIDSAILDIAVIRSGMAQRYVRNCRQ